MQGEMGDTDLCRAPLHTPTHADAGLPGTDIISGRFQSKALTLNAWVCDGERQQGKGCLRCGFPGRGSAVGDCFYIRCHSLGSRAFAEITALAAVAFEIKQVTSAHAEQSEMRSRRQHHDNTQQLIFFFSAQHERKNRQARQEIFPVPFPVPCRSLVESQNILS